MDKKPTIIFDTDMDTDCDDAGALLLLVNAHLSAKINLTGVIADSLCAYAAPFCKTVLDYYRLNIPVGEIYGHVEPDNRFSSYLAHQKNCERIGIAYNTILSERRNAFYDSTELYLQLLSKAEDHSVTVLCVGMLTAVFNAVKADRALFERKVERVVIMGNPYKTNDFNLYMDAQATKGFFELCPAPVFISYLGSEIITGNLLDKTLPAEHPVKRAYEIWSKGKGRASWDLIAALFATNLNPQLFKTVSTCRIAYDANENRATFYDDGARDTVIGLTCSNEEMANVLNDLLV